jgi:DDE family transposase
LSHPDLELEVDRPANQRACGDRWTGRPGYPLLDACLDRVTAALHEQLPELGSSIAIDASDMPARVNGQRDLYKGGPERKTYSDPDASWGQRSAVSTRAAGSFCGYKLHQVVCPEPGLPLARRVKTAKASESTFAVPLLESVKARGSGLRSRATTTPGPRGIREPRLPPDHPAARDSRHQGRQAPPAHLRAR